MWWQSFHDAWWRLATQPQPASVPDALVCRLLHAGSLAYGAAVSVRNAGYDRGWHRQVSLPCAVVSVGNLTVGGTGKTTCVELIARKLADQGRRVAVLSRGYGGSRVSYWLRAGGRGLEIDGQPSSQLSGVADEPQLLAQRLPGIPILVGARRERTGRLACAEFGADAVVLDDGFQHRRVRRDCEIVLVHVRTPMGGWALLPRGPMREPLESLRRAHVIIITKADEALELIGALSERLRALNPEAAIVTASHEPDRLIDGQTGEPVDLKRLDSARVGLLSSIGDPDGFEATVRRLHATVLWHEALPDHHRYQPADWPAVLQRHAGLRPDAIVTTEKDWVRLRPVAASPADAPVWVLGIRMKLLTGEEGLDARLAGLRAR